jgi:hypothetical protein
MGDEFDRLFAHLRPAMKRHEDGTPTIDTSHPAVQQLIASIRSCCEAGSTLEEIRETIERGVAEGLRRAKEAKDGR